MLLHADLPRRADRTGPTPWRYLRRRHDAHAAVHLDYLRYGIGTAQRGWLTTDDVINTWPLTRLGDFIDANRRSAHR